MKRVRTPLLAATVIGSLAAAGVATAPGAQASDHKYVPRTTPSWVGSAHSLGNAPAKGASTFRVYLAPKGGLDAEKAAVEAVSTPGSAQYGKFLSPAQFAQRFQPTAAAVKAVRTFLTANNLKVTGVESQNRYVSVSGTNAAVEKAFGTQIKKFTHEGHAVQANTSAVKVPSAIAGQVLTVSGLDTTPRLNEHRTPTQAPPPAGFNNARPCSIFYGQVKANLQADYKSPLPKFMGNYLPYAVCGYTGPQFRAAYQGANPNKLDGTGTTIAILDAYASPTQPQDAATYASRHGDGGYAKGQFTQVTPGSYTNQALCGPSGWFGEEALDIEAEHAMAPGANITYYAAQSCDDNDFLAALTKIVSQNKVDIVSNSWGNAGEGVSGSTVAAYEQTLMQAALQGIGVTFSSGDAGDEVDATGIKQADYPASDPYITAVGGTADAIDANGQFEFQTGWGTDKYSLSQNANKWVANGYLYGAGGGVSALFNKPSYQEGVVPTSYSARAVPDVAMDADPTTGMLIGLTQRFTDGDRYGEYRIGGTSLASPLFAGQTALLQQHNGGKRLGFLNPLLYAQSKTKGLFNDVSAAPADAGNVRIDYANMENPKGGLVYSVRTFNQNGSLTTGPGWDDTTGIGSPGPNYINATVPKS